MTSVAEAATEDRVEAVAAAAEPVANSPWSDGGASIADGGDGTGESRSIDSIALMRELTSLSGLYDEAGPSDDEARPKAAPVVTRPVNQSTSDKQKKKRGLFGR